MSSVVLDFFHSDGSELLNYILRLRGTTGGIVDLAGNTIVNHNVTLGNSLISGGGGNH